MSEWINVVDTAIKIGLGAGVAGAFSIYRDKHLSKKERSKFLLTEEYQQLKETIKLIAEYQDCFRICAVSQDKNYQTKFEAIWPQISKLSVAITNLLYLELKESCALLKQYNSSIEAYVGSVQQHIIDTGGDGYQNRLEPLYGSLVSQYEKLIEKISNEFNEKQKNL